MLVPVNRYITVVLTPEPEQTASGVLLPEDYKTENNKHTLAEVKKVAADSKFFGSLHEGDKILVEASMVERVAVAGSQHELVLENYVIAQSRVE